MEGDSENSDSAKVSDRDILPLLEKYFKNYQRSHFPLFSPTAQSPPQGSPIENRDEFF